MTVPQAIKAYNSLATLLATAPTEAKRERELNMTKFKEAFEKLLVEMNETSDAPMRVRAAGKGNCKVYVLTYYLG
jgi:hypothetical protein